MTTSAAPSYAGYRFPVEVISHAVWLPFRFPLSLRMVDGLLAARGTVVSNGAIQHRPADRRADQGPLLGPGFVHILLILATVAVIDVVSARVRARLIG